MKKTDEISCPITPLPLYIGPYKIVKKIAAGGMGEVFVAIDPFCQRNLALKKIRSDKIHLPGLKERFLKEVKIAAQLSHPSIIPIYQIHQSDSEIYYTMPLVKGETLKEIIQNSLKQEKEGLCEHPIGSSIPALMRIFFNICQAIAYCHSKNILHRDLKPENIIVGPYGEVLILDWGLADYVSSIEDISIEEEDSEEHSTLTRPGKIAGTLAYLSPERVFGKKASYASDIYSLGIILYQLLTLRFPFRRKSVKQYKKDISHESIIEPCERAPYRDIPPQLSYIAKKCLAKRPEKRYAKVEEIVSDLNSYIEGHAKWVPHTTVRVDCKDDWKFQENILLAKHIALTGKSDFMEWVTLMIAKESFFGKIKIETHVHIKEGGSGLGFLLNLKPLSEGREFFQDSFFIWIGSEKNPGCFLFRSNVELLSNPDLCLKNGLSHFLCIEKTDHHIRLYIDKTLAFDYLSHTPFHGPHFGVVLKDADLELGSLLISKSSPNILVNCLSVPDTLLSLHHFKEALSGYRQIAQSFAGRPEGKEAVFRSGIVLLEEAKKKRSLKDKNVLMEQALEEFSLLKEGAGSPLEYLGKSLVYKDIQDLCEEVKCLELALRRFVNHPLLSLIKDQILFRLHEASYKNKIAAYEFALLTLRYIPEAFTKPDNQKLLQYLQKNCKPLPFLLPEEQSFSLMLHLSFQLGKPRVLSDILSNTLDPSKQRNILYCLLALQEKNLVEEFISSHPELKEDFHPIVSFDKAVFPKELSTPEKIRQSLFFLSQFYVSNRTKQKNLLKEIPTLIDKASSSELQHFLLHTHISYLFYLGHTEQALSILQTLPSEEENPFSYLLQGCALAVKDMSLAKEYFSKKSGAIDIFLSQSTKAQKDWLKKSLFWEKVELFEHLCLLYQSAGLKEKAKAMIQLLQKEYRSIQ